MLTATRASPTSHTIDNTDWLKVAAIVLVSVDHVGYFFMGDADLWWRTFGRLAAPPFFFLIGYAKSRTVPLYWIWLGVILTLLESWNADWTWVAPNILLSFALIRTVLPRVQAFLQHHGWIAFALLVAALVAVVPITAPVAEYGATGWLWALLGLCQRIYVDRASSAVAQETAAGAPSPSRSTATDTRIMRLLVCLVSAISYVWQEQIEFAFPLANITSFVIGIGVMCLALAWFRRGPSRIQPPQPIASCIRFVGRHTLELYAIQLAGSELIVKMLPDLVP